MRVSIIVNNYNYRRFLGAAIDSALAQDHADTEIIVVDDGSTDGSVELLESYRDRVELLLKDNEGQSSAVNAGYALATGDAIIFLDADDQLLPDAATRLSAMFEAHPDTARIHARALVIDENGDRTGAVRPEGHRPLPAGDLRENELAAPFDMASVGTSGNAFSRAALAQIMPIPADRYGKLGADWYLIHLTTLLGDVLTAEEPTTLYRLHDTNVYGREGSDVSHQRMALALQQATIQSLQELAERLDIPGRPRRIVSMANALTRLISLRFDPAQHPVPGDSRRRILADAMLATRRRSDVGWPIRLAVAGWCLALAIAPVPLARRLSTTLLQPPRAITALSKLLHTRPGHPPRAPGRRQHRLQ